MTEIKPVLGIDLGTTYSCVAYVDSFNKAVTLKNYEGKNITPSVVFFESPTNIVVGESAKQESAISPARVVSFVKRDIGTEGWCRTIDAQSYSPEQVSAYILKKLVQDANLALGLSEDQSIRDVVITCPAYFGINEREATRRAGEIAGLNVLQVLNEPTAAAIAYGMSETAETKTVLVYDLGGGTFDVTMIQIEPDAIRVICTGGDKNLGGKDWDDAISNYLMSTLADQAGVAQDELSRDAEFSAEVLIEAENLKKSLSSREKGSCTLNWGSRQRIELSRDDFEVITASLVERTVVLTQEMLEEARQKGVNHFDALLLVGGSCRMPMIAARLKEEFKLDPQIFDPDESVAKGAAIFGTQMRLNDALLRRVQQALDPDGAQQSSSDPAGGSAPAFTLASAPAAVIQQAAEALAAETGFTLGAVKHRKRIVNVSSQSFGVVAYDARGEQRAVHIILKNTEVPCQASMPFGTHEANQTSAEIQIVETDSTEKELPYNSEQPDDNISHQIGEAILDLPGNLPAQSLIEVTFSLNEEGRLSMTARDKSTGNHIASHIETTAVISQEAANAARQLMASQQVD